MKLPETFVLALLLFPGFLSERVAAYFVDAPVITDLQLVASALAATFVNLVIAVGLAALVPGRGARLDYRNLRFQDIAERPMFLGVLAAVSVAVGLAWAWIDSRDAIYKLVKASDRISRRDILTISLKHAKADGLLARVATKDAVYHGHIKSFSVGRTGGLYIDRAQQELTGGRSAGRVRLALSACDHAECRIPVVCIRVGRALQGAVFVPIERIEGIEFRPHLDTVTDVREGKARQLAEYSCDVLANRAPAAAVVVLPKPENP